MRLDHKKLAVYARALEVMALSDETTESLPRGRSQVREQMDKAATSVVANVAEGAGEFQPREKARFFRIARRSAVELAAWFDIVEQRGEVSEHTARRAERLITELVAMLVKLTKSCERLESKRRG